MVLTSIEAAPVTLIVGATLSTATSKLFSSVRVPSLTRTVKLRAPGPSAGVHENNPVAASRVAPFNGVTGVQVRVSFSGSVAAITKLRVEPSFTVFGAIGAMVGASFCGTTLIVTVPAVEISALALAPLGSPRSRTVYVKVSVPLKLAFGA